MAQRIEDYALVGDTETSALVGKDGSVDWMCLPRFDSAACFAALLGDPRHGRWLIGPQDDAETSWRYRGNTFVLETTHTTDTGTVEVLDYMPIGDRRADIVRVVRGISGTVTMRHHLVIRYSYGKVRPWVKRDLDDAGEEVITAIAGPDMIVLHGDRLPEGRDGEHCDTFDVSAGETVTYSLTWVASHREVIPAALPYDARLQQTQEAFEEWAAAIAYDGPYAEAVRRSLLVLKALTDSRVGGIVAAPTTSLPEAIGGDRNWDYRYCWLRDASLTIESLLLAGFHDEVVPWRRWLLRALAGDPADMQIMYGIDGARELDEKELDHLPGYESSRPVRIGNAAVSQRQTDVLGEVMVALEIARDAGVDEANESWALQRTLVDQLAEHWEAKDNGIWEIRGELRHFTHSRVMVWVAFDRAVQAVEQHGLDGDVERWRAVREAVRAEVLEKGYHRGRGSFVQHYETDEVDASLLLIPAMGFLPGDDERVVGTVQAVEQDLMRDGLIVRYRTESGVDGLEGDEHPFLACNFWLVMAYAHAGRMHDATALMDRLVGVANGLGLMAEEYDTGNERMIGNYPQAFSHLTLVNAALTLARLTGDETVRTPHAGETAEHAAATQTHT